MERVLFISPHIDDAELAMGGTMIKHAERRDILCLAVLNCVDCLAGDPETRKSEQRKASALCGADTILLEQGHSLEYKVKRLDEVNATIVYFPFETDTHQDHVSACQIGMAVSRKVRTAFKYLAVTSQGCYPNWLNVIDIAKKKELVSVFETQINRQPKLLEIVETQNRYFGSLIPGNGHYAEGFVLHRHVAL